MTLPALKLQRQRQQQGAAQSTIDALMYSLRSGCAALAREDVRRRLAVVDQKQLREMCMLLQKRDPTIAPPWSDADLEKLIETWVSYHG